MNQYTIVVLGTQEHLRNAVEQHAPGAKISELDKDGSESTVATLKYKGDARELERLLKRWYREIPDATPGALLYWNDRRETA